MLDDKLIGLLGGAFDPIHNAHISIAEECIKKIGLKKIIFIPTGSSANKKLTNYNHRLEMVSLVCNNPNFQVSDFEIKKYLNKKEISYTIDTLKFFSKDSKFTLCFILGSDAFSSINSWYKWKDLLNYTHLIIIERSNNQLNSDDMPNEVQDFLISNTTKDINALKKNKNGYIYTLPTVFYENSSTEIKNKLKKNASTRKMLPEIIREYILRHKLYSVTGHIK
ncbi:MAG: nicotinate (nicotinamide) nucleotide adenylyltransferase [Nitrosomonadales bacterium]|nr:nicotinate (nicotinamide) nucleotide adenylyltransferase [Nitrosomonadales bacterium]|tara:strand:+ start:1134 stop:1802 length:669 start_codon:yes stop_codon:yes gene_type:complete